MRRALILSAALTAAATTGLAQTRGSQADTCADSGRRYDRRASFCEVREETVGRRDAIDIDAGTNGGISIKGSNRRDILVRAIVRGYADSDANARRLTSAVQLVTRDGRIRAEGPSSDRYEHWSASFEVEVPQTTRVTLNTHNGGIALDDFRGTADFRAVNGGVSLNAVSGDIRGTTTNGGLKVDLNGDRWEGRGLDVETHNGGISLTLPARYSAELETGTVNGGLDISFPITVKGWLGRTVTTTLGSGGPRVRVMTTNGGVSIRRR